MRILLLAQYFKPETVGAAIWIHQLAVDLVGRGHDVTIVTGFPNIPDGVVFSGYRGRLFQRERIDGVTVIRNYLYTSPSRAFLPKLLNFATFSATAGIGGIVAQRPNIIYAILPPLPLGLTANILGTLRRVPVIINVQDIWPHAAAAAGLIENRSILRICEAMESSIYRHAQAIAVISEGFHDKLRDKGVPSQKITVIGNWADLQQITPLPHDNEFRRKLGLKADQFVVIYSGSMSHNSCLDTIVRVATILRDEPFSFVIVGDGVKRAELADAVAQTRLANMRFLPFQPIERYPEVLAAADISLIALHRRFTFASVPSKTYKIMASGRPILALAEKESEVRRVVEAGRCGFCVPPDDAQAAVEALRYARCHRSELCEMGAYGRQYVEGHFNRRTIVGQIESLMLNVVGAWTNTGASKTGGWP